MIPVNVTVLKLHSSFSSRFFSHLKLISWLKFNFCFCKSAGFVSALIFSRELINLAVLSVLVTYLTGSLNYDLAVAARIVDAGKALSTLLVIFFTCISAFFGDQKIIIFSAACSILGLMLLFTTTLLEGDADSLSIKMLVVIGVVFVAVGRGGMQCRLGAILADQLRAREPAIIKKKNESRVVARTRMWLLFVIALSLLASTILNGWTLIFTFSAAAMGIALVMFLLGVLYYHCIQIQITKPSCNFVVIYGVVKAAAAAAAALFEYSSSDQLFPNDTDQKQLSPQIEFGWLEDVEIPEEQEEKEGIYTVKDTKLVLQMVPLLTTFVVFSLVVSTGETFFPEQANAELNNLGIILLIILQELSCRCSAFLCNVLHSKWVPDTAKKQAHIVRIWVGMLLSIFCCSVAWRIEVHRLIVVNSNEGSTTISIFWLVPQNCLLGLMQGFSVDGLRKLLMDQFPEPMQGFVSAITELVTGLPSLLSIVSVYVNRSLFAYTLNDSRLDKYFMRLTFVSYINWCYFMWVIYHLQKKLTAEEEDERSQAANEEMFIDIHGL